MAATAARQPLRADIDGFGLHAVVPGAAHDRKRLEQVCRCITRPTLSGERVQVNATGQVELNCKTPWRDGSMPLVTAPLGLTPRLAALVPAAVAADHVPRWLALNAKLRAMVVPKVPPEQEQPAAAAAATVAREVETVPARPHRISRVRLLKRVFDIDMQHCSNCDAGELKMVEAILERPAIEKTLTAPGPGSAAAPPPPRRACEAGQKMAA